MDTPFEEVLEKAKAGDPKAQTEVRTLASGGRRRLGPQHRGPGQELLGCVNGELSARPCLLFPCLQGHFPPTSPSCPLSPSPLWEQLLLSLVPVTRARAPPPP